MIERGDVPRTKFYYQQRPNGIYLAGILVPVASPEIAFLELPSLYLRSNPKPGDRWHYGGKVDWETGTQDEIVDIEITGPEGVTVPAGIFTDCLRMRVEAFTTVDGKRQMYADIERWFAPDVGIIKYHFTKAPWEEQASDSFTAELVSYEIK